jgi:hypothetical protein
MFSLRTKVETDRLEIYLNYEVCHISGDIVHYIKGCLGGTTYFKKDEGTYLITYSCYNSINFSTANAIISYFDNRHLLSKKYLDFLKWRKAYEISQVVTYKLNKLNKNLISHNTSSLTSCSLISNKSNYLSFIATNNSLSSRATNKSVSPIRHYSSSS